MLHWSKLNATADDKLNATKIMKIYIGSVENIVRKGENAGFLHFLLFSSMFSEGYIFKVVKSRDCVVKN